MNLVLQITYAALLIVTWYLSVDFGTRLRKLTGQKRYTWIPQAWMITGLVAILVVQSVTEAIRNYNLSH